jgi:hypothetical protein
MLKMLLFKFVGCHPGAPAIPESEVQFHFSIFAKNEAQAKEGFNEIFPGCFVVSLETVEI